MALPKSRFCGAKVKNRGLGGQKARQSEFFPSLLAFLAPAVYSETSTGVNMSRLLDLTLMELLGSVLRS
jgi:hypothetical protein